MVSKQRAIPFVLVFFVPLLTTSVWAVPVTGFLEGTAANGWQGSFAVQLTDGSVVTGVHQITGLLNTFQSLPVVTTGCTASPSCTTVTNSVTSTNFTMTALALDLSGSSTLGSLGSVSWGAQPAWVLPGDPSPPVAVLANANGTLGGTTLRPSTFSFGFNSTLTSSFTSVSGGQALSSLRLDFTDGIAPPTSRTLLSGPVFINNGVPVALGTPLAVTSVPEPSTLVLFCVAMAGLVLFLLSYPSSSRTLEMGWALKCLSSYLRGLGVLGPDRQS